MSRDSERGDADTEPIHVSEVLAELLAAAADRIAEREGGASDDPAA